MCILHRGTSWAPSSHGGASGSFWRFQEPPLGQLHRHLLREELGRSWGLSSLEAPYSNQLLLRRGLDPIKCLVFVGCCHTQVYWKMPSHSLLSEELRTALVSFQWLGRRQNQLGFKDFVKVWSFGFWHLGLLKGVQLRGSLTQDPRVSENHNLLYKLVPLLFDSPVLKRVLVTNQVSHALD